MRRDGRLHHVKVEVVGGGNYGFPGWCTFPVARVH
jgi:hypothetical protein